MKSHYEHEFKPWAVDHNGDFVQVGISKIVERGKNEDIEEHIATFNLENLDDWFRFDLKGGWVARFFYRDGSSYYQIAGPCKFRFSEHEIEVQIDEPCHVCGSRCENRRCVRCGRSVCGRDVDDADPEGKLPESYGPCWSEEHDNVCRTCGERRKKPVGVEMELKYLDMVERDLAKDHTMSTEELLEMVHAREFEDEDD